ncbi:MAG: ribosome maturation factor RimP [Clostridia bacterium]
MAKKMGVSNAKTSSAQAVEERAAQVAQELSFELVEVTLQKESRGKCLCIYVDKEGGIALNDCERFHKQIQPLLEDVDYDFLEVSSPGIDRPIKTARDFERNRGQQVEVKLFAPLNGEKLFHGSLKDMNADTIVLTDAQGMDRSLERKSVAIVKPIIELSDEDFSQLEEELEADSEESGER